MLGAAFAAALAVAGCSYTPTAAAAHVLHVRLSMRVSGPLSASIGSGDVTGRALSAVSCRVQDGAGNVSLAFDLPPKNVAVQGSVGNVSVSVPLAHRYHVTLSDNQGNMSTAVPDDPTAPNKITLSESIGNVALG